LNITEKFLDALDDYEDAVFRAGTILGKDGCDSPGYRKWIARAQAMRESLLGMVKQVPETTIYQ
jgi:hypothetical protein